MVDWSNYGKTVRSYKGSGNLCFDNHKLTCSFELVQLVNGNLYALCKILQPTQELILYFFQKKSVKLTGETDEGNLLIFSENTIITSLQGDEIVVHGKFAKIKPRSPQSFGCFKFALTNLVLNGRFNLNMEGYNLFFEPVAECSDIIKELKVSKGVAITCEIKIEAVPTTNKDEIITILDDICMLLTLAQGCRVSWLYYDFVSADGTIIESFHGNAITKPFVNLPLIPADLAKDTKDFIQKTFPNFVINRSFWALRNAIDAFTDAKVEGDFLESRALKLVILMEHLKSQYLKQKDKEYILYPPAIFNASVDQLIKLVQEILTLTFPEEDKNKLSMMANHVRGLNWFPFGRALSEICKHIGLATNSKERRQFIDIRNELVHHFKFCSSYGNGWDQFAYLMTFIGKIFLAILRYDGHYYDWTKFNRGETAMRNKLELLEVKPDL